MGSGPGPGVTMLGVTESLIPTGGNRPLPTVRGHDRPPAPLLGSLQVWGFRPLYAAGFLSVTARWGMGFLAAYVANELTSSPRAVQLTGAAMWAPLLLAGVAAGGLADRWDRHRILLVALAAVAPAVAVVGLLELSGRLQVWVLYPLMVMVGLSWVADMTSRRTLVIDIVGVELIDNAMALESFASAMGLASGVLAGGAVVEVLGVGTAFLAVSALLAASAGLVAWSSHSHHRSISENRSMSPATSRQGLASTLPPLGGRPERSEQTSRTGGRQGLLVTLTEGRALVAGNRSLRAGLGVTVIANVFYFSHTPLVPVFAARLGAGAFRAGLMASAGGVGMMVAAVVIIRFQPPRRPTYVAGAGFALLAVIGIGVFDSFITVYASLLLAAVGFGLFAATQSVVVMTSVDGRHKGQAMGLLSMAIGVLPIGMYSLGELAELAGPPRAVISYASVGLVVLAGWVALTLRPQS